MPQKSVVSWNAIISACLKHGQDLEAQALFKKMPYKDLVSWTTMITAYSEAGHLEESCALFNSMPEWNVVTYTAMLTAYSMHGIVENSMGVFENLMPEHNICSWAAIVTAYARNGHLEAARHLLEKMPVRDVVACTAMIEAYASCGELDLARKTFNEMDERDLVSWNVLILAYASLGRTVSKALDLFFLLQIHGVECDEITFTGVLAACARQGKSGRSRDFLVSLSMDYGLRRRLKHFSCVIDSLARAGQLKMAQDLLDNMPFFPDSISWTALMGACRVHGDTRRGLRSGNRVMELEPHSAAPYMTLCRTFNDHTLEG
ncbi:pentatricopeptide repeat-containing protein At4g02750-like [Selaginella moellendorffii]|uniref:pentatricopeptide repeat-containing protein At4g02750-like n=1 Tax=Selaginella moellendorffii TaxID=88036 RepID=UPI000D1CE474|nr:pentatricopeptide repeat-containing protein At4g02750-like [Selaginella moellendorffii]|eukprot:XP_024523647.1 pentatricopeptide repeat-containing protein At4g02750-like [Selaginella moellendorffii]